MPWQRLRRAHVLKIRSLLEEQHYQPATANRMLSALRGVLKECWHAQLMTTEESDPPSAQLRVTIEANPGTASNAAAGT